MCFQVRGPSQLPSELGTTPWHVIDRSLKHGQCVLSLDFVVHKKNTHNKGIIYAHTFVRAVVIVLDCWLCWLQSTCTRINQIILYDIAHVTGNVLNSSLCRPPLAVPPPCYKITTCTGIALTSAPNHLLEVWTFKLVKWFISGRLGRNLPVRLYVLLQLY
jgi:hypothetical protein